MRIIIAPDKFKEALSAQEVCAAIARGVRRVVPDAEIDIVPMADGGEGTVEALIAATGGTRHLVSVAGPLGDPVRAVWGMLGGSERTAVMEMAAATGLALVPPEKRNPLLTSTYGTGQLVMAALDAGARRILIGIGGSATNDGGIGAAQAIGVRFLGTGMLSSAHECGCGEAASWCGFGDALMVLPVRLSGGRVNEITRIDLSARDPRIAATEILVACDVDNPLCGARGASAIYGPQKGATPDQVQMLDRNLGHLAGLIKRDLRLDVADLPGAGAAGGLGAGLVAFFGARLQSGVQIVMDAVRLADRVARADLVITGEGRIDRQSMMGKVIAGVGRTAKAAGVPCVALVGCVGDGAEAALEILESYHSINPPGTPLSEALLRTAEALERTMAEVLAGRVR
ncbi:MAG TPA: glycerate kinase [Phycisphaerae bacterium]|nr:glycerate kinase [Phycisphaerae bacterium]HRY68450.1 glycerate kinase [Phycisphaerae bacterium]HSA28515.1 glycerate kinase [Phycisphaerae bacterium]